ncbi:MAG: hypothetical protein ACRDEA_12185, partial [Microcystaceae cyanobacterium]
TTENFDFISGDSPPPSDISSRIDEGERGGVECSHSEAVLQDERDLEEAIALSPNVPEQEPQLSPA